MNLRIVTILAISIVPVHAVERRDSEAPILKIHRIYIDQMGGGPTSDQMRDMVISALQNLGMFTITENPDKADAFLRGSSDDKIFTEDHSSNDSIGFHANAGGGDSSGAPGYSVSSNHQLGAGISQSESSRIQERRHEAQASVRLVNADGDVIWSTTQDSLGSKFHSAMADVADKIARKLSDEVKKARAEQQAAMTIMKQ